MWPQIAGAVAGAAASRLFSDEGPDPLRQAETNASLQREFAQHGIRWRVEDAKAAGLHPLYAIGGAGASFSPNPITVGGENGIARDLGQNITRAVMAQSTAHERAMQQAQLGLLNAQQAKEFSMAHYYDQEAARIAQQTPPRSAPFPSAGGGGDFGPHNVLEWTRDIHDWSNLVKPEAAKVVSARSDEREVSAGSNPFWAEYQLNKNKIQLPWTEEGPGESLENIPWYGWPAVIGHNIGKYGAMWPLDALFNMHPSEREAFMSRLYALGKKGRGPTVSGRITGR